MGDPRFRHREAIAEREGQAVASEPSNLSMRMGLSGIRYAFGPLAKLAFAVRGDVGFAQLETEEGPRAIQGLTVNVQRLRVGAEASLPMALGSVPISPFIDVGGLYDGGDGETGGGVELAGGFRFQGPAVSLEVKGRTLAMHSADSYAEEGVKATLVVGPDGRKGFRLMLAPRWGGAAEAMDIFRYRSHPFAGALRRQNPGWGMGTRVSYGFDLWRRPGHDHAVRRGGPFTRCLSPSPPWGQLRNCERRTRIAASPGDIGRKRGQRAPRHHTPDPADRSGALLALALVRRSTPG